MNGQPGSDSDREGRFPAGFGNIFGFACFNALSFQMILGSPMVLYAKNLHASATTLGIIAGMLPILVIFQIPAARFVDSIGYKRFVVSGWSIRTIFVALMALVPLSGGILPDSSQLALVIMLLFSFNLSRGISSCGWLPWISSIIPARMRGRYLTNEAAVSNIASLAAFAFAALMLGRETEPDSWRFSVIFGFSTVCAMISLRFLTRIPAETRVVAPPPYASRPRFPVMWRLGAFRKLLILSVAWSFVNGGVLTFVVAFMKEIVALPEQQILFLSSLAFLGAVANQLFLAGILDQHGSKPVLGFGLLLWAGVLAGWLSLSGEIFPSIWPLLGLLMLGIGLASSMVNLATVRLAMIAVPEEGRSHYFAVYSVVGSLALGAAPVLWGMFIDAFRNVNAEWLRLNWNAYSLLFALLIALSLAAFAISRFLEEAEAGRFEDVLRHVLERSRLRFWLRAWFRTFPRG